MVLQNTKFTPENAPAKPHSMQDCRFEWGIDKLIDIVELGLKQLFTTFRRCYTIVEHANNHMVIYFCASHSGTALDKVPIKPLYSK